MGSGSGSAAVAPPPSEAWLARPRLLAALEQGLGHRLTLLHAPAGYGKSHLLADFVGRSRGSICWYHLDPRDADPVHLAASLVRAAQSSGGGDGADGAEATSRLEAATEPMRLAALVAARLETVSQQGLTFVLDGYEAIARSPASEQLLAYLLTFSPPGTSWLISTRVVPRLPVGRLRLEGSLLEMGAVDLAFTLDEVERYLAGCRAALNRPAISRRVYERTRGWPAGVAAAARLLRGDSSATEETLARGLGGAGPLLYDYFAEEILAREDAETQRFLLETSSLPYLEPSVCDELLELDRSAEMLEALHGRALFIGRIDDQGHRYAYQPQFCEFLVEHLRRTQGASAVRAGQARAAAILEATGEWDASLTLYAQARQVDAAAALLERVGWEYLRGGQLERVSRWLDLVLEAAIQRRPWLLALRAGVLWRQGAHARALEVLEQARWLFQAAGDEQALRRLECEAGFIYFQRSRFSNATEMLRSLLDRDDSDAELRAEALTALSLNCRGTDDLDGIKHYGALALDEFRRLGRSAIASTGQVRVLRNMALGYLRGAQPEHALDACQQALLLCESDTIPDHEFAWALAIQGTVLAALGRSQEALEALGQAQERATPNCEPQGEWLARWRGIALRDLDRFAEAASNCPPSQRGRLERAFLLVRQGRRREALQWAEECYRELTWHPWVSLQTAAQVTWATALGANGLLEESRHLLQEAATLLREKGYRHKLSSVNLHLARALYATGRSTAGDRALEEAFTVAAQAGLYHFWWWDPPLVLDLCTRALSRGLCAEYAGELARRRFSAQYAPSFLALASVGDATVRSRAWTVLRAMLEDQPIERVLDGCQDPGVRKAILADLAEGVLTPAGLIELRRQFGLSWKEVQVFSSYYLRAGQDEAVKEPHVRQQCARTLCLSENTLKTHVNRIRRKLRLDGRGGILPTYRWAQQLAWTGGRGAHR